MANPYHKYHWLHESKNLLISRTFSCTPVPAFLCTFFCKKLENATGLLLQEDAEEYAVHKKCGKNF